MVSTVRSPSLSHSPGFGSRLLVSLITIHMSAIDGYNVSSEITDTNKSAYTTSRPIFPSEEPSEIELHEWVRSWGNTWRDAGLLRYMKEIPEKTAEYTPKPVIATPEAATDALKASIVLKNHEITTSNRQRDLEWKQLV